jgi:hypothetical protein
MSHHNAFKLSEDSSESSASNLASYAAPNPTAHGAVLDGLIITHPVGQEIEEIAKFVQKMPPFVTCGR